jgi:hypothetical protein
MVRPADGRSCRAKNIGTLRAAAIRPQLAIMSQIVFSMADTFPPSKSTGQFRRPAVCRRRSLLELGRPQKTMACPTAKYGFELLYN